MTERTKSGASLREAEMEVESQVPRRRERAEEVMGTREEEGE